jgi:hypothetical protein
MQTPAQNEARLKPRGALTSLALGLMSIALNLFPAGLVLPLRPWLGDYPPLFLPLVTGALAFGLALCATIRGKRLSWLALGGLILGTLGMLMGSLIAVVTVSMFLSRDAVLSP